MFVSALTSFPPKLSSAMDISLPATVSVFECISSEGATANPLKRRSFRRPMEQPGGDLCSPDSDCLTV